MRRRASCGHASLHRRRSGFIHHWHEHHETDEFDECSNACYVWMTSSPTFRGTRAVTNKLRMVHPDGHGWGGLINEAWKRWLLSDNR
jgi:hypothetical protein